MSDPHNSAHHKYVQGYHKRRNPFHPYRNYTSNHQNSETPPLHYPNSRPVRFWNSKHYVFGPSPSKQPRGTSRFGLHHFGSHSPQVTRKQRNDSCNDSHSLFPNWSHSTHSAYDNDQDGPKATFASNSSCTSACTSITSQNLIVHNNTSYVQKHGDSCSNEPVQDCPENSRNYPSIINENGNTCNRASTSSHNPMFPNYTSHVEEHESNHSNEAEQDYLETPEHQTYHQDNQCSKNKSICGEKKMFSRCDRTTHNDLKPSCEFKKSNSGWYHVIVWRQEITDSPWEEMKELVSEYVQPTVFQYYKLSFGVDKFSCYICDHELAKKLFESKGHNHNGPKFSVRVFSTTPTFEPSSSTMEILAIVISKRFNSKLNHLDLSKLHDDPDLLLSNCFVPLGRADTVKHVFSIISSTLPDLESINLDDNKIFQRESLAIVASSAPLLKTIHLKNNHFREVGALAGLQPLKLKELNLAGNPFPCADNNVIVIINLFPTLEKLDGFDLKDSDYKKSVHVLLPPSNPAFMISNDVKLFVKEFIHEYMELFDSNSRQNLAAYYQSDAQFSLVALDYKGKNKTVSSLIKSSRNFLRLKDETRQTNLLHQGRDNIIAFLSQLPSMRHEPSSLTCDCPILTSKLTQIYLTGIYEVLTEEYRNLEISNKCQHRMRKSLIYFNRAFLFTPDESGHFLISNEQMFVTNVTQEQYIKCFSSLHGLKAAMEYEGASKHNLNQIKTLSLAANVSLNVAEDNLNLTHFDYDKALLLCLSDRDSVTK